MNRRIEKIVDRAGIDRDVSAHDLRNTYGTMLARKDFGRWKIKQMMGHASLDAPEKYIKFVGDELDETFREKW